MTESAESINNFWQKYQQTAVAIQDRITDPPETWGFGDSPEMADELGQLVFTGIKTATCSLLWEYEAEQEPIPQVGELSIVLDGHGDPLCIIKITEVIVRAYSQVDAQFAYEEGEGDRSLSYWRAVHWRFFSRLCDKLGLEVSEDMALVCERFQVLFPETLS